jgi:hypothetical protein
LLIKMAEDTFLHVREAACNNPNYAI